MDSVKFREEIDKQVKAKIKELRKDGTVSISMDNLWQCVRISPKYGPKGALAVYYAKEIFIAHVRDKFKKFVF